MHKDLKVDALKRENNKSKILTSLIVIIILLLTYTLGLNLFAIFNNKNDFERHYGLSQEEYNYVIDNLDKEFYNFIAYKKTKKEIKDILDAKFNAKNYLQIEVGFDLYGKESCYACTSLTTRVIFIRKDLSIIDYTHTLCHELTHLKKCTANEKYCEYNAFVVLYNSDDAFLRLCAYDLAIYHLKDSSRGNYSAKNEIANYLYKTYKSRNI